MPQKSKPITIPASNQVALMLGYLCVKDCENLVQKVSILDRFDLLDSEIASICDCAIQSVRNSRQRNPNKTKADNT
jgi:hypothetical protein